MIDPRREARFIWKEFEIYQLQMGESIVWFRFDTSVSAYNRVYDEGGRDYHIGVRVPALWVDQSEDVETYTPDGRRPTQRLNFAVSTRSLAECGIDVTEAHGARQRDHSLPMAHPWLDDRLNDVLWYDDRFWSISNFQIRGRLMSEDVVIGVSGIELQTPDESLFDKFPQDYQYWS